MLPDVQGQYGLRRSVARWVCHCRSRGVEFTGWNLTARCRKWNAVTLDSGLGLVECERVNSHWTIATMSGMAASMEATSDGDDNFMIKQFRVEE